MKIKRWRSKSRKKGRLIELLRNDRSELTEKFTIERKRDRPPGAQIPLFFLIHCRPRFCAREMSHAGKSARMTQENRKETRSDKWICLSEKGEVLRWARCARVSGSVLFALSRAIASNVYATQYRSIRLNQRINKRPSRRSSRNANATYGNRKCVKALSRADLRSSGRTSRDSCESSKGATSSCFRAAASLKPA